MKIAVLVPCYNEALTVKKVIDDFKMVLPEADIYVYDNNSKDDTSKIAAENGAIVVRETRQGKGNVVRSMFRDIDADYYIMVDGDDTYPAEFAKELLKPVMNGTADMTIGDRLSNGTYRSENKRAFHNFGNNLVKGLIGQLFKNDINDIMTGYRAFNRYFVKTMPVLSGGFEIETEMSIHALDKKFLLREIPIDYRDRPEGSNSKLNTYKDGIKVLKTIVSLFKDYKPLPFFLTISIVSFIIGLLIGIPVIVEFFSTHFIDKIPSAILALGFILISILLITNGLILDTLVKQNRQNYELFLNQYKMNKKD
ncbi:Glycosyltransferase, catalytic subunit of cellulose synthase and poly-beta-1,6-N-acetylglucosamine synthase [Clostridium acidisoli DSM 12555]|uniref:Glycosyltransferase, catalytic subunit of cellulose synthase and poly-beta-1,6-N-acetylglucosamine synthase n=1 Tax=Clostridium acidisoli DSM 12555 TaxID=1121291 RepID=A0A1W1XB45_9CLOT|nr:glycosyltransferase family 2 protein [Clostridium acidisoli]SMC20994.1 Glycosyltransferase, catalytic subunit of cellulose synthase and poly-beta-1,6-N-acetylglucosamine synthase [Clostridium acidisoli DSM 12555]